MDIIDQASGSKEHIKSSGKNFTFKGMIKILVIQLNGPADLLLSTLLIRCLKMDLPEVELHYLLHHNHADVLATNPYIDHLHQLHFNRKTTLHELMPQAFDHVWDLQHLYGSSTWVRELQAEPIKEKQKGWKGFFTNLFASKKVLHPAEQYLQMAKSLAVTNDERGLDFFIPKETEVPYKDIPASHHAGYIAIAMSAEKDWMWPANVLEAICHQIDHPIILIGMRSDAPIAEMIKSKEDVKIYDACGKFSIYETADLVRKSRLLIAFQPYYIQLGAALKKEMVVLTEKTLVRNEPYYSQKHLKSLSDPPFDKVVINPHLFKTNIEMTDPKLQKDGESIIKQVVQAATRRLRATI